MTSPTHGQPKRHRWRLLLAIAAVPVIAAAVLYAASEYALRHRFDVPRRDIPLLTDSASLARGRHLAVAIGKCVECHGDDLGGAVFGSDLVIRVAAPNLTRGAGGVGHSLTPADIERAVRHGVGRSNRGLVFMPSMDWQYLTDEDIAALAAYISQAPPVHRVSPGTKVGVLGRALFLAGKLPLLSAEVIDHEKVGRTQPRNSLQEEGKYLAWAGGCHGCHGDNLTGGPIPGLPPELPPAANISSLALADWTYDDFQRVLRTGVRPDGRKLHPLMPYRLTSQMKEEEIRALFAYLKGSQVAAN